MKIVFDLDGTLALIDHRRHLIEGPNKDWRAFYAACVDDEPNQPIINLLTELWINQCAYIEIWSGRSDEVRKETEAWLNEHVIEADWSRTLRMREEGDFTVDHELKERWLRFENPKPDLAFDDRQQVVDMWRRNGIVCCQVAPGDF